MSLNVFLIFIIVALPSLLLLCYNGGKISKSAIPYFLVITVAIILSYWTFTKYAKSHDGYYKNTDYHIIQQEGFKYSRGQDLWLCKDSNPDEALISTGIGDLWIDGNLKLNCNGFKQPLYVQDNKDANQKECLSYHVINNQKECSMNDGEELVLADRYYHDTILLKIRYEEIKDNKKITGYRFVFSLLDNEPDTVEEPVFRKGYNLAMLLQKGRRTLLDANMYGLFENCYIIRDQYTIDVTKARKTSGAVYLFGKNIDVYKNGRKINSANNVSKIIDIKDRRFFYGLGETQSPIYHVTETDKDVFITYRIPQMYHFPNDIKSGETTLFITTDLQDIVDHSNEYKCFYQFSNQVSDDNRYKASAVIDFVADNAGISLNPQYVDLTDNNIQTVSKPIAIDQRFEIKSISYQNTSSNHAQLSYIFKIRDLRRNEVYMKAKWLYILLLFMMAIIYSMLNYMTPDKKRRINKLYIIETSVYLVFIAFLTVRFVLLWRLHAFPPIDNVSKMEFETLTSADNFYYTIICVAAVLVIRVFIILIQWRKRQITNEYNNGSIIKWINKQLAKYKFGRTVLQFVTWAKNILSVLINKKDNNLKKWEWWIFPILLTTVVCIICWLIGRISIFSVVMKEVVAPLLIFAINSMYYTYRISVSKSSDKYEYKKRGRCCWIAVFLNTGIFLLSLISIFKEQGMLFPMIGTFAIWFLIAVLLTNDKSYFKWFIGTCSVCALLFVFLHVPFVKNTSIGQEVSNLLGSRIKARIETLAYTPTEMIENDCVEFKSKTMQDILNASSNKWFIDSHLNQRHYLAKNSDKFILDKEYNQLAVKYTTQTCDVMLVRFLIYEQGKGVIVKLIVILLLLTINVVVLFKHKGDRLPFLQQIPIQSSLFLVVFSSYLFLVNLNAVVFVGLDFPFLTLTSNVAPMSLLLPLLMILLTINIRKLDDSLSDDLSNPKPDVKALSFELSSLIVLVIIMMMPMISAQKIIKHNDGVSSASFTVSLEPITDFVNNYLNPKFIAYQDEYKQFKAKKLKDKDLKEELTRILDGVDSGDMGMLDNALREYSQKTRRYNDTLFIKSAFKKFFNTTLTDTKRSLLHIRKLNGQFVFCTNKLYFDMKPMFKNDLVHDWEGDLLGAHGASKISFTCDYDDDRIHLYDGYYEYGNKNDVRNLELLKKAFLGTVSDDIIAFNIYQIPVHYCYLPEESSGYVYVIYPNASKQFTIYPAKDATHPINETKNIPLRIKMNDIVKVNGMSHSFAFKTEHNHYFSKRIHYNGKHQAIYPLGKKFMFAYNFDQMLANDYHPSDSAKQPVRISLDYDLFEKVYDYCERTMRTDARYGEGVTVTAIDGYGRIRLLADYNPKNKNTSDPNHNKELQQKMEEIYLNGNRAEERAILQNRNVARMAVGPGSTIKVPFFVASASTIKTDWSHVRFYFPDNENIYTKTDKAIVKRFANYQIEKGIHNNGGWDELRSEYRQGESITAADFIATSNNYFFGSMLALATYNITKSHAGLDGILVNSNYNEITFPKFSCDNNYYGFKDNFIDEYDNNSIALEDALMNNFNFYITQWRDYTLQTYDVSPTNYVMLDRGSHNNLSRLRSLNSLYIYSERPLLHRDIKNHTNQDIFKDILHMTSGGAKCLDVTPLNMAEMYLRIALLNSAENILTYDDNVSAIPSDYFNTVIPQDDFSQQMSSTTYWGMWNVINSEGGYHRTLKNSIDGDFQNVMKNNDKPIYIYGKTGTVGDPDKQRYDNKHYAFILTNKPLHLSTNREGLKVYVVYFGYYNASLQGHSGTATSRKEILQRIIDSETFKAYWNN